MEKLKSLDEITNPDKRNKNMLWTDDQGSYVSIELRHLHRDVSKIKLNDTVPEIVREHFSQALNLAIYSWFNYQFNVTASFMSFVTLELALKEKLKSKSSGLYNLLNEARDAGLLRLEDSEIKHIKNLRNEYAHGANILHNQSVPHMELCADLINKLFISHSASVNEHY